jgi:rhomboid family GlyGly-CTERM serine protease
MRAEPDRSGRPPLVTAGLSVVAVAATFLSPLGARLEDARDLLTTLEWWRPLTGHLPHAGALHLVLNLAVFVPLGALRESRVGTRRFLIEYLALAGFVSAGVRLLHGHWDTYRGLSGVVYGLLTVTLLARRDSGPDVSKAPSRWCAGLVAFLAAKSALEYGGEGWLVATGWLERSLGVMYLPGSHCAGIAGGAVIALVVALHPRGRLRDHAERRSRSARDREADSPDARRDAQDLGDHGERPLPGERPYPTHVLETTPHGIR